MTKRYIRVWDIPKILFDDLSEFCGVKEEKEEYIFPQEVRIWRELKDIRVGIKPLICLRIFPKKDDGKMQRIFYLWAREDIRSWEKRSLEGFCKFSNDAIVCVDGCIEKESGRESDVTRIKFFNGYGYISAGISTLLARVMLFHSQTLMNPDFKRESRKIPKRIE